MIPVLSMPVIFPFRSIALILFIMSHVWYAQAQLPQIVMDDNGGPIQVLDQLEIDKLTSPSEGFQVFNSTTGCLNYFLNRGWFQLCGQCLPVPEKYVVDSITQKSGSIEVHFQKGRNDTLVVTVEGSSWRTATMTSPARIKAPFGLDSASIHISVSNKCYALQWPMVRKVKLARGGTGPLFKVMLNGKETWARKVNGVTWLCMDAIKADAAMPTEQRLMTYAPGTCPTGWSQPTVKEWETLLSFSSETPEEVFAVPSDQNSSIGLSQLGAYSVDDKELMQAGRLGSYWTIDTTLNGLQRMINISPSGYIVVDVPKDKARLNVRCVRHE